jgi:AcrR family transcriptional regulator
VIKRAGISRRTFYELFPGKAAAFWAAHELALASLRAHVHSSYEPDSGWPERLEAATAAAFAWAAANRGRALLVCGQPFTAGPHAARCQDLLVAGLSKALGCRERVQGPRRVRRQAVIGGLASLVADRLSRGDGASLSTLPPALASFVLTASPSSR